MTEPTPNVITDTTYKSGDVLRVGANTATILHPSYATKKRKGNFSGFWARFENDGDNKSKEGLLRKADLEKPNCAWKLSTMPHQPAANILERLVAEEPVVEDAAETEPMHAELAALEAEAAPQPLITVGMRVRNITTGQIRTVKELRDAADITTRIPEMARWVTVHVNEDVPGAESGLWGWRIDTLEIVDAEPAVVEPAVTTADLLVLIQSLRSENERLAKLASTGFDAQLQSDLTAAHQRVKELEGQLEAMEESRDSAIAHDAAGSDYRAELAEDVKTARCPEFVTLINWLPEQYPERLVKADKALAEKIADNWEVFNFVVNTTVIDGESVHHRIVTLTRKPAIPAPQPGRREFANPVPNTHVVVTPAEAAGFETPLPVGDLPVNERKAHYQAILTNRNLTSAEKTALLNQSLVERGAHTFKRASAAFTLPVQSLSEVHHD